MSANPCYISPRSTPASGATVGRSKQAQETAEFITGDRRCTCLLPRFRVDLANIYRYAAYWNQASEDWSKTFSDALPRYAHRIIITHTRDRVSDCEQTFSQSSELPPE